MARFRRAIGWICLIVICLLTVTAAATDHFGLYLPAVWILFVPALPVVIGRPHSARGRAAGFAPIAPPATRPTGFSLLRLNPSTTCVAPPRRAESARMTATRASDSE